MPTIISSSIAGMIFAFIFATKNGILNSILENMHLISSPIKWLTSQNVVMAAVTILAVWGGFGNYMLYFVTGMTGISEDIYESAKKTENINGIDVDVEKAQKLIKRVIVKEKRNLSTKEFSNPEMIRRIKKMIEEDVECY